MRKYLFLLIKIFITAALLYWAIAKLDFHTLKNFKYSLNVEALLLGLFFVAAQFFTGVWRWRLILPLFNVHQPFRTALQIYWIGMFFNNYLPTGVAGDALRIQMMKQANTSLSKLFSAVFLDRLIGLLVLLLIIESSLFLFHKILAPLPLMLVSQFLTIGGTLSLIFLSHIHRLPIPWHASQLTRLTQQLSLDTSILWQHPTKTLLMFTASLLGNTGQVLSIYFLAHGLNLPISFLNCWILGLPVILAMSLPISIGGWGIREGAMISFLGLIGISATAAFSLSILFGLAMFLIYLPGSIFWIFWHKEQRTAESTAPNPEVIG